MNSLHRTAILVLALLVTLPCQGRYLDEQDVLQSPWYTGSTGSARLNPIASDAWLLMHQGKEVEPALGRNGFVIEDPQLTALVYEITNRLLQSWPGNVPQVAIYVIGEASPTTYGAETTQAREIFLYYGVLVNAQSEDELAAVIAHELGHVLLDHVKTLNYKKKMRDSVYMLGQARDLYATAEAMHYDENSKKLEVDPEVSKGLKKSASQQMVARQLYDSTHATLFSRSNEFEADRFAIDLLIASGYSAMGLKTSLERLAHSYDLGNAVAGQLQESSKQLMDKYTTQFNKGVPQKEGDPDYSGMFNKMKKDLGDSAVDVAKQSMLGWATRSHPVTDKRIDHFAGYLQQNYSRKQRRQRENRASAQRFRDGDIGQLLANYRAANEAIVAIRLDQDAQARQLVSAATSGATARHAYPRYAAFSLQRHSGTISMDEVQGVRQYGLVPVHASLTMADALVTAGSLDDAVATAAATEAVYGNVTGFYPIKIKAANAAGNQAEAQELAQSCFDARDASKTLTATCAQLAGIDKPNAAEKSVGTVGKFGKSLMGGAKGLFSKDK